jgi:hypothetical protein
LSPGRRRASRATVPAIPSLLETLQRVPQLGTIACARAGRLNGPGRA